MVLTGKLTDPSVLSAISFGTKARKPSMDSKARDSTVIRRGKIKSEIDQTTSINGTISENDGTFLSAIQRTGRPNARRILEDDWQEDGIREKVKLGKNSSGTVNKYTIIASKGELARSDYTWRETTPGGLSKRTSILNSRSCKGNLDRLAVSKDNPNERDASGLKNSKNLRRGIQRPVSVPAELKEDFPTRGKASGKSEDEGILKKSSAFLANLAHEAASRISERYHSEDHLKPSYSNGYHRTSAKYSILKDYFSILHSPTDELHPLYRSPSVQTLPTSWKKKSGIRVKKSVSFSSDTSFEEKRAPFKRAAIHEVKAYHKGVLQDRSANEERFGRKVPPSWETPSEGRSALLRAARDADEVVLNDIVTRAKKFGLEDMDVNITDSSGRTAISYMAGNGASAMLELALSFDGVDPNIPDNEGNTPLHFAAQAGQTECLNILLQRCPDIEVDARNSSGFTPLMKAALQGRTKCAKILLFAGANPTLRDHGRGLRAEQWARFCGRYVCAEVIERFARHRLLERSTSCRWGSEPELAAKVLQGKVTPIPAISSSPPSSGFKSKIRKVFRTTSGPDRSFSLVSQLTSAALCASSPALPKSGDVPPVVKSLLRPLSVPQLKVTLVSPQDFFEKASEKYGTGFSEKIENTAAKPTRAKKKNK